MRTGSVKQAVVWAMILIVIGVLSFVNVFMSLSAWAWVLALAAMAVIAFVVYLTDRSAWSLLIPAYVMLAIAVLVALLTLGLLRGEVVAVFVMVVIAIPFLAAYLRDRAQWWFLIPAYVMLAVGLMIGLQGAGILGDELTAPYVLLCIAIPFFIVFLRNREQWWFLIPAGVLTLIALGLSASANIGAYIIPIVLIAAGVVLGVRLLTGSRRSGG